MNKEYTNHPLFCLKDICDAAERAADFRPTMELFIRTQMKLTKYDVENPINLNLTVLLILVSDTDLKFWKPLGYCVDFEASLICGAYRSYLWYIRRYAANNTVILWKWWEWCWLPHRRMLVSGQSSE